MKGLWERRDVMGIVVLIAIAMVVCITFAAIAMSLENDAKLAQPIDQMQELLTD